jgi:uncharacterized repeat protein (TIGR01451 family)
MITSVVIAAMVFVLAALAPNPAAAASPEIEVTLSLDWFERFEVPDDGIDEEGEFFPEIRIGNGELQRGRIVTDDHFIASSIPDPWVFKQTFSVPDDKTTVPVMIRIFDDDGGTNFGVDRMDVSPANQDIELNLEFDLLTERWSGDGVPPNTPCKDRSGVDRGQTCAAGDGDPNFPDSGDGKRVTLGFSVRTSNLPDVDGDGIPDLVELNGVRNPDGSMVADLKALGSDPCRKSVVVQLDYMSGAADGHSHKPKDDAIKAVKDTFDAAPVDAFAPCPYGGTHKPKGIDFVHVPGKAITEQTLISLNSNDYRNARNANFPAALAPYAHYGLIAHDRVELPGSSGQCCEPNRDNNKDFIVSLGSWRVYCVADFGTDFGGDGTLQTTPSGDDMASGLIVRVGPNRRCDTTSGHGTDSQVLTPGTGEQDAQVGTVQDQAGTIIHELGHALNLDHGGDTNVQWKPNYVSAMNYWFQTGIPTGPPPLLVNQFAEWKVGATRLGLSEGKLPGLNENSALNENAGIGDGSDQTFWWIPNPNPSNSQRHLRSGPGNTALNWNDNRTAAGDPIIEAGVRVDLNADSMFTQLSDHDDWKAIKFRAKASPDVKGTAVSAWGVGANLGPELNFATAMIQEIGFFNFYDPDLKVTKTADKADGQPGDTLNYSVLIDNVGTGPATKVSVTDTLPDATTATRLLTAIESGSSATEPFSYAVPCTIEDGTVLTNSATATSSDVAGGPEANTSNNTGTASTTIHAPKLTLTKTATSAVNAGEAVTTELLIANVGTGSATDVELTDVLPPDMYYSTALDLGAGPRPSSVVRNPDGTTTLTWALGQIDGGTTVPVEFTARPSLLLVAGTALPNSAAVTYENSNGCVYDPVTANASTTITEVAPTGDPLSQGYWKTHPEARTAEFLARVQATDQRFDGADGTAPDGALSNAEATAVLSEGGNQPGPLESQLLAVLLDLSSRRINAGTTIDSSLTRKLGIDTVGEAVRFAFETLAQPLNSSTAARYSDATTLLDQIANNKSEVY